jgi:hypothetical protein
LVGVGRVWAGLGKVSLFYLKIKKCAHPQGPFDVFIFESTTFWKTTFEKRFLKEQCLENQPCPKKRERARYMSEGKSFSK